MYSVLPRVPRHKLALTPAQSSGFTIHKHKRFWQVTDADGQLVCLTVYRRGAKEVVRRLTA
ncbi:MAG: hypothetical protein ACREMX_12295 [Gemmatimonadales bacterium]